MSEGALRVKPAVWPVVVLVVVDVVVVLLLLSAVGAAGRAVTALDEVPAACVSQATTSRTGPLVDWADTEATYVGPDTLEVLAPTEDGGTVRVRCRFRQVGSDPSDERFEVVDAEVLS